MWYKPLFLIFTCKLDILQRSGWVHTPLDALIGVWAYMGEEVCMTFDVHDDGRLAFTHTETNLFSFCLHKEVMVISKWWINLVLDPDPQKVNYSRRIWIMERRPISILTWDYGEFYLKVWVQDKIKHVPYFQYFVKICRKILGARSWKEQTTNVFWRWNRLSLQHLKQFWRWLWGIKMSRKIVCFRRLLVHSALSVNNLMVGERGV